MGSFISTDKEEEQDSKTNEPETKKEKRKTKPSSGRAER